VDLASPLASFGRPTGFGLGFGSGTVLLNNSGTDGKLRGSYRTHVEHGDVTLRVVGIVRIMGPRIGVLSLWMPMKLKNFYSSIPYRLAIEYFEDGNAIDVSRLHVVEASDYISKFIDVLHRRPFELVLSEQ